MHSDRRNFIRQAGISAAAFAAIPSAAHAMSDLAPQVASKLSPELHYGSRISSVASISAAFENQLAEGAAQQQEAFDTSWTERVTGKHRAMFDIPEVEGGVGIMRAAMWSAQCKSTLHAEKSDTSTVIVIRHSAIPLVMNQDFWSRYKAGQELKLKNDNGSTLEWHPMLPVPGKPAPTGAFATYMLDQQIQEGAIVLGCDLAFRFVVAVIAKQDKISNAAAREQAKSMLIPGVIMQPSGFFANVLAQQAGCAFVYAV